jgi:hypothetical protein
VLYDTPSYSIVKVQVFVLCNKCNIPALICQEGTLHNQKNFWWEGVNDSDVNNSDLSITGLSNPDVNNLELVNSDVNYSDVNNWSMGN